MRNRLVSQGFAAALGVWFLGANGLTAQDLRGVVDIHAHCSPDVMPRSIDGIELAKLALKRGMRAVVLKNHYEPTVSLAMLAGKAAPSLTVFGGIALNRAVGGINPAAVERMVRVKEGMGKVVWMPTFDAENQVRVSGEARPFVSVSRNGRLLPEVVEVLRLIGAHDLVLATGHSSPEEVLLLVREAGNQQVRRIVVTHAMLSPIRMSLAQMQEAARLGAMIEFVWNALIGQTRSAEFQDYADAIRKLGIGHSILSSDLGQAGNPLHPDGLLELFAGFREAGLSASEIEQLAKTNPARLLGLQ